MPETIEDRIENFKVPSFDPRFQQFNQLANCRTNYIDYHRCRNVMKAKGKSTYPCKYFKYAYKSMCPSVYTKAWDEQIEEGVFFPRIEPHENKCD